MATKTQRIALVCVVVLGTGAVVFDRLVLGGAAAPQVAAAEDLLIKDPGAVQPQATHEAEAPDAPIVQTVAHRLNELPSSWPASAEASDIDAFAVPAHWLAKIAEQAKPASNGNPAVQPGTHGLLLSMVARKAGASGEPALVAFINGQPVKIGESVEGYTLVEVHASGDRGRASPAAATLEGPSGRVELVLDPVLPSSGAAQAGK